MASVEELWPLFQLRLRTGDLELRLPRDEEVVQLAELTRDPIHPPERMPFFVPWTDEPEDRRVRGTLQWNWRSRAEWTAEEWRLELAVFRGDEVVGTQGVHGKKFAVVREVETGSWVGRRFQGQGIGKAMRRAVLHLAFAGLGANTARSGAFADNAASLRVSEQLGYRPDGTDTLDRRGEPATLVRLAMSKESWEAASKDWPAVTIEGLDGCREMFGI